MTKYYICLFIATIGLTSFAQEEDEVCLPPAKKVMKLIDAANKAQDAMSAVTKFNAAIEADEENAMAYYEYAMYAYEMGSYYYERNPNPAQGDKSFKKAQELFLATLEICPDYHSNCSYYLGVIYYSQNELPTSIKWFKKFKEYKHSNTAKYAPDHDKRLADVNEVVGDLEYDEKIKTEEVPFDPKRVRNVCTSTDEYFPMISPDNELMYFTRKNKKGGPGFCY